MRARVDKTQKKKKKKGVEGKLDNCVTIGGSSRCSTQDREPDTKWRGNAMKDAKTFRLGDKTTLLHLVITQEIIRVKWVCQAMWLASFTTMATPTPLQHLLVLHHPALFIIIGLLQLWKLKCQGKKIEAQNQGADGNIER
jgi:hypothetical protein